MALPISKPTFPVAWAFVLRSQIDNGKSSVLSENIKPQNLRGLKQALFVLDGLEQGKHSHDIAESLGGDAQIVEIWTNFLIHNHWIKKIEVDTGGARYLVTDKGGDWIRKIDVREAD